MNFSDQVNIDWYRSPVDREVLSGLMKRSNLRGFLQTFAHLGWFFLTASIAYGVYQSIDATTWPWAVPLLLIALFVHGTMGPFMGLIAVHELQHRTVFRSRALNEIFEIVYAFISWSDYIWYQESHARHHRATCHRQHDGEVVLPLRFTLRGWRFWLGVLAWNPMVTWNRIRQVWRHAQGKIDGDWYRHVLPEDDHRLRRRHRNWARILLIGHSLLALTFIASGHWFLIVVFTFGTQYCSWLGFLMGVPQHYGLNSDEPDFRLSTRTYTCSWLPAFYYWNMQYHLEHHMYPAVPFHQLPGLRAAIEQDLPRATHGLYATWRELLMIRRCAMADQNYRFVPDMHPSTTAEPG